MMQRTLIRHTSGERRLPLDILINLALMGTFVVGYRQLAEPYCKGESHPLPVHSRTLSGYPCGRSTAQELTYIFSNARAVMWDMFRVHPDEGWATLSAVALLLRLAMSVVLPPRAYAAIALPVCCYGMRALFTTFLLLKGPHFQPSALALRAVFRNLAGFDVGLFGTMLGVWRVRPAVELVYCCFMAAAVWLLAYWHGHLVPGGVNWPLQIATRLLVPVVTLGMEWTVRRRATAGADAAVLRRRSGATGGGSAAVGGGVRHRDKCGDPDGDCGSGNSGGGGASAGDPWVSSCSGPDAAGQPAGRHGAQEADQNTSGRVGEGCGPALLEERRTEPAAPRLVAGVDGRGSRRASAAANAAAAAVIGAGGALTGEPPAAGLSSDLAAPHLAQPSSSDPALAAAAATHGDVPVARPPPAATAPAATCSNPHPPQHPTTVPAYIPFFQYQIVYNKIPWAEPEQLAPNYRERLRQVVEGRDESPAAVRDQDRPLGGSQHGPGRVGALGTVAPEMRRRLANVYVRRGCVELTVVVEEYAAGPLCPGTPPRPPHPPSSSRPWLDVREVLRALGLEPPPLPPPHPANRQLADREGLSACEEAAEAAAGGGSEAATAGIAAVQTWWLGAGSSSSSSSEEGGIPARQVEEQRSNRCFSGVQGPEDMLPGAFPKDFSHPAALGGPSRPRVLSAWPRAVLLPPQPSQQQQQQHGTGAALPLPPSRFPLTLRVVVDWGQTHAATTAAATTTTTTSTEDGTSSSAATTAAPPGPREPRVSHHQVSLVSEYPPCGSSAPVAPVHWRYSEPVRVLVRAGNSFLPARIAGGPNVADVSLNGVGSLHTSYKYDVEVLQAPAGVGTMLVELSRGSPAGGPSASPPAVVVIPLLVTDDAGSAGEISDLAARWPDDIRWQLDGLLYDAGSWMEAEATRLQDPAPATWAPSALPRSRLGAHLREFFASADCPASLELLNRGGSGVPRAVGVQPGPTSDGAVAADAASQREQPGSEEAAEQAASCGGSSDRAGGKPGGRSGGSGEQGLGGKHRGDPGSASSLEWPSSGYHAQLWGRSWTPTEQWAAATAETISLLECGLVLSLMLRAHLEGAPLTSVRNLVIALRFSIGALLALARIVLPYSTWIRLAVRARVLRYGAYVAGKAVSSMVTPAPSGIFYATGVAMLLYEGLVLPGCCLLDFRTAMMSAAIKLPLNARLLILSGTQTAPAAALLMAGRVEALALGTTAACHWYLRRRQNQRQQQETERAV